MEETQTKSSIGFLAAALLSLFFNIFLVVLGAIVLFLLVVVKSKTIGNFWVDPVFFSYSIFVTVFVLSRLVSASMYRASNALFLETQDNKYQPRVSFVIPCKNEEGVIERTVAMCFSSHYPREKKEIIVVNDGSTEGTLDVLKKLKKRYASSLVIIDWEKNQGKRNAMAEGIKRAKGEIIIQIDSDSYIDPETFPGIITPFKDPSIGAVSAHTELTNPNQTILTKMQAAYYFMSFRIMKAAESTLHTVFCCSGSASAYRRDVIVPILDSWRKEKFLGQRVTWGDDRSLTSWVLKAGYKTLYSQNVIAYTDAPATWRKLLTQQLRWKKSWIINSLFTLRFIFFKQPFVAFVYFLPLVVISFITPFIMIRAMFYSPIVHGYLPIYYLLGIFLITTLVVIYYRFLAKENKYWPYLYLWMGLNIVVFAPLMIYAALRLHDRSWGTR